MLFEWDLIFFSTSWPIFLWSSNPISEILIPLNVNYEKFAFKNFNEIEDAELVIKLATKHNSKIVIGDSYRISNKWIEKIQKNNIKVILIDDLFIGSKADLSINYTPFNSNNKLSLNLNQIRSASSESSRMIGSIHTNNNGP